jgi:hypothetical protein
MNFGIVLIDCVFLGWGTWMGEFGFSLGDQGCIKRWTGADSLSQRS